MPSGMYQRHMQDATFLTAYQQKNKKVINKPSNKYKGITEHFQRLSCELH